MLFQPFSSITTRLVLFRFDFEHSLFGHWRSDKGVMTCDGTRPVVDPLLLGRLVELEHGEGLLGAGDLTNANDDLATAFEDRVQGLVDQNRDGLGGVRIMVLRLRIRFLGERCGQRLLLLQLMHWSMRRRRRR